MQHLVGQVGVGRAAADDRGQVVDRPLVEGDHGHDLLGQDVEGVAQVAGRLDGAGVHALDDDRGLEQVGPVLGEDAAPAGLTDLVAGPADALQAAGHRARRLDLDDEVDGAHVDAQLQAAGGDQGLELAPLQLVLDVEPALPAEGAVVGLHQLVARGRRPALGLGGPGLALEVQLVEAGGQALGQAPGVDEDDGRVVLEDQLQQAGVHRGPDGAAHRARRRPGPRPARR